MKKSLFMVIVILTTLSCSDDDNTTNNGPGNNIIGTWKLSNFYNGTNMMPVTECEGKERLTFNASGNMTYIAPEEDAQACTTTTTSATWSVDGDMLTMMAPSGEVHYQILELDQTTLHMKWDAGFGNNISRIYTRQ